MELIVKVEKTKTMTDTRRKTKTGKDNNVGEKIIVKFSARLQRNVVLANSVCPCRDLGRVNGC